MFFLYAASGVVVLLVITYIYAYIKGKKSIQYKNLERLKKDNEKAIKIQNDINVADDKHLTDSMREFFRDK